ncbi:hypothetical protein HPP92_006297 [Vanilla planifolia]|uniref:Mannan endo-1,4-beta-mannosidase n=1 Tax=Vanilla planifolia TaxID=51239 RepID=A0A835RPD4_VANPL|nr:hypothetical protein HPP92_006297 [Vanilla planifolia]
MESFSCLLLLFLFSCLSPISQSIRPTPTIRSPSPVKAVNLGGWLVTEGWITPNLFDEIPVNKDLLDGTQIQLKSITQNNFFSAENGGGSVVDANRPSASGWETFKLWRITESTFQFRVFNWQFFGLDDQARLVAVSTSTDDSDSSKTFELVRNDDDPNRIRLKAPNGSFLQANSDGSGCANHPRDTNRGDDDPSVFLLNVVGQLQGEFQVTNGYGHDKASSVMTEHWNTFIVEDDFKFMSHNGITAVRIQVGWWIMFDPNPPSPFVGGSLQALDNAVNWAEKYKLKVIIDLHAAPGSQNGWEHSGTRDGLLSWGQTDDTIDQTVAVINFIASRYASRSGLYAIELINEPLAPGVTLDSLERYYKAGYNAIIIDVHYYNLFSSIFEGMTVQQNINYVYDNRASTLGSLMVSNGPLIFIGEWVDEMDVSNASEGDYQHFGAAQLDVYGRATFGWSYWTLKNVDEHWSLEWMIKNGYITL